MSEAAKRVGVVIPFYRAGNYIAQAIRSVVTQRDYPDWHLYLINDGSDDNDVEIALEHCRKYPDKLTYLEHPHGQRRGISASRNLGIHQANTELIAFLDADDIWTPDKLLVQVSELDANPDAAMVYGPALRWHSWNGGTDVDVPAAIDGYGSDCYVPGKALLATFLRDEAMTPCIGSVLIRKSALIRSGCFEEQFQGLYDDQVLYAKLCTWATIYVSSRCVSFYRKHPQSCCQQSEASGTHAPERARFLNWLRDYLEAHGGETAASSLPSH